MPRKKKDEDNRPSAAAESKPKSRIPQSLQNLLKPGKASDKRPSLSVGPNASARQASTSLSTFLPKFRALLPSSANHNPSLAVDLGGQQSLSNVPSSPTGDLDSNRLSSRPNLDGAAAPDNLNADAKSIRFAGKCVALLRIIGEIVDVSTESLEEKMSGVVTVGEYCGTLAKTVGDLMESEIPSAMRDSLEILRSELARTATEDNSNVEDAWWRIMNCLQMFVLEHIVTGSISPYAFETMEKQLSDVLDEGKEDALRQSMRDLPRANAAYNDYTSTQQRVSCFRGTRQALLHEVIAWLADPDSNVYVLSGLAGIGKSTIAQTLAGAADKIHLLGASFFFSRDEEERRTAKLFFTTIAFQLCLYDTEFAEVIGGVLSTERGKSVTSKFPLEQLETLVLEPLRKLTPRKVVIIVDALDECDDTDALEVIMGLNKLVQVLPAFKVVLTTRPQPCLQLLLDDKISQMIFHLHDIEDKIVDGDIELYLRHSLSWEQVRIRLPTLMKPWAASDEDIYFLVRAAGRLFIVAFTAVLFIVDRTRNPAYSMKLLLTGLAQARTPFNVLNDLYITILRTAVPRGCKRDTIHLYQTVIGSIIIIQQPLSISALATLANLTLNDITVVLANLQPVIFLGSDNILGVYHKSFSDYIQDPSRCTNEDLRIDSRFHHTQMAIHCLRLLNQCLKQNILDLKDSAQFMDNDEALEMQDLTRYHVFERIPSELQYACLYFANHIQSADKDVDLAEALEQFLNKRILNWLEALSWLGKLGLAHPALLAVQTRLVYLHCYFVKIRGLIFIQDSEPTSSSLRQLVSDGRRFVSKFYDLIQRFALHTYHSALPFTPTETTLYTKYSKQITLCRVQGGPERWDALISKTNVGIGQVKRIIFSPDSKIFAFHFRDSLKIFDETTGVRGIVDEALTIAIANNFTTAAAAENGSITLYSLKGVKPVGIIKPSQRVSRVALSPNGSRLVLGLANGIISIWDTVKCVMIQSHCGRKEDSEVTFSSCGSRIAFISCGIIKLLDGTSWETIADLEFPELDESTLMFSGGNSRLACLTHNQKQSALRLFHGRDGECIGTEFDVGDKLTVSPGGSVLVTGSGQKLKLWNGKKNLSFVKTLDLDFWIKDLAISPNASLLGIASLLHDLVALYDIQNDNFTARLTLDRAASLAFSPDCTRLAAGNVEGDLYLWDISSITSRTVSQRQSSAPTHLAFSPDCSSLASRHDDGTIKLWDTSNPTRSITLQNGHLKRVTVLAFSIDGGKIAAGLKDQIIQLWSSKDGVLGGALECPGTLTAVTLSSGMLAAATKAIITLFDLETRTVKAIINQLDTRHLTLSHHTRFLGVAAGINQDVVDEPDGMSLTLLDTTGLRRIATFDIEQFEGMVFSRDDSRILLQCHSEFQLFKILGDQVSKDEDPSLLGLCPHFHGLPMWVKQNNVVARFPQQEAVTVLFKPNDLDVEVSATGSSMIALGCKDGSIFLVKAV